jgi:hypothetical protein
MSAKFKVRAVVVFFFFFFLNSSRYCSDECGLDAASLVHAERELKLIQESVEAATLWQQERVRSWITAHPNFLSECLRSEETSRDLEVIATATKEVQVLKDQVQLAETIVHDQVCLCLFGKCFCNCNPLFCFACRQSRLRLLRFAVRRVFFQHQILTMPLGSIVLFVAKMSLPSATSDI